MPFFFTTPGSNNTPRALNRFSERSVTISDSSAKGMESGSVVRILNGWTNLSNYAARTMYMKILASLTASGMLSVVSSNTFT